MTTAGKPNRLLYTLSPQFAHGRSKRSNDGNCSWLALYTVLAACSAILPSYSSSSSSSSRPLDIAEPWPAIPADRSCVCIGRKDGPPTCLQLVGLRSLLLQLLLLLPSLGGGWSLGHHSLPSSISACLFLAVLARVLPSPLSVIALADWLAESPGPARPVDEEVVPPHDGGQVTRSCGPFVDALT